MVHFRGIDGNIIIDKEKGQIFIERSKMIDFVFHDKKKIVISTKAIKNIEMRKAKVVNGYISIITESNNMPSNIYMAMKNNYTVIFRFNKNVEAMKFVEELYKLIDL